MPLARRLSNWYQMGPALRNGSSSYVRLVEAYGSGEVFVCKTVKLPPSDVSGNTTEDAERFRKAEVEGMTLVECHPNTIDMEDLFEDEEGLHMVIELCPYGDVLDHISSKMRLGEEEALHIVHQVASALQFCHRKGLVHRDVKPENIFISGWKNSSSAKMIPKVKLADFGSCVVLRPSEEVCQAAGTLDYTAPEVIMGEYYSFEVDIWGLGVSLYAMLTGHLPFTEETSEATFSNVLNKEVDFCGSFWNKFSPETVHLLQWMMTRDRQKRATAADVLSHPAIQRWVREKEVLSLESGGDLSPKTPLQFQDSSKTLHINLTSSKPAKTQHSRTSRRSST